MKFLVIAFLCWVENNEWWENISVYLMCFKSFNFRLFLELYNDSRFLSTTNLYNVQPGKDWSVSEMNTIITVITVPCTQKKPKAFYRWI